MSETWQRTASALKAHREWTEHEYFEGNHRHVVLLRQCAREYDAWVLREKAAKKGGRKKLPPLKVSRRKAA